MQLLEHISTEQKWCFSRPILFSLHPSMGQQSCNQHWAMERKRSVSKCRFHEMSHAKEHRYTISSSYASFNETSPGYPVCPSDITYLKSAGAEFCTSFNHYVAPHTASGVVGTVSSTSTVHTTVVGITTPPAVTQTVLSTVTGPYTFCKRTVVPTPASITAWQSSRISEACSQVATGTITDLTVSLLILL